MTSSKNRRIISPLQTLLAASLTLLLFWVPLPHGSVTPGALLMTRLFAAVALATALFVHRENNGRGLDRLALVGLGGIAGVGLLQSLPWPRAFAALVSPAHVDLADQAVADGTAAPGSVYLSLAPDASRSVALTALTLAALLVAAFAAGRHSRHRRWIAGAVLVAALGQVLYGLRPWLAGRVPRVSGTFVNPDHLAVQLEIALCVGLAAIWGIARWTAREHRFEVRVLAVGGALFAWVFLFVGLVVTGSRAGLVSGFVGVGVGSVLLAYAWGRPRLMVVTAGSSLGLAIGVLMLTGGRGLERVLGTSWHDVLLKDRPRVWAEALPLMKLFPATGTGLGSFEEAFPLVQHEASTRMLWGRAHNDLLELALTSGVVGTLCAVVCAIGIVRPLITVLRRGLRTEDRLAAVAALSALAAVATHELFDFGLSLPANAAAMTVVVGAASAARLKRRR